MEKAVKRYAPIFVLPTFLAFVIGFILPFIEGLYLSFCQFTTVKDAKFIGIGNYQRIFTDSTFTNSFKFTVLFAVASDTEIKRNQYFQNHLFHAEPDWWNRAWIYLADSDQLCAFHCWKTASGIEYQCRLLGTDHPHVLAADWLHDDHLYCGTSECIG